jgi:hypothetical protein
MSRFCHTDHRPTSASPVPAPLSLLLFAVVAACQSGTSGAPAPGPRPEGAIDLPEAVPPGLSGLESDPTGALWAVAERGPPRLVRWSALPIDPLPHQTWTITGLPEGEEPESLAIEPGSGVTSDTQPHEGGGVSPMLPVLWIGTEGDAPLTSLRPADHIYRLEPQSSATTVAVGPPLVLPWSLFGLDGVDSNTGIEGLCSLPSPSTPIPPARHPSGAPLGLIAVGEATKTQDGRRVAPLARLDAHGWSPFFVPLTTKKGKLSALHCTNDGAILAIERHYEDLALLHITLPDPNKGDTPALAKVHILPLPPTIQPGTHNFEGLTQTGPDLLWLTDNQNKEVTGPTRLHRTPYPQVP